MKNNFSEVKLFQVKPDKLIEFETLITTIVLTNKNSKLDVLILNM